MKQIVDVPVPHVTKEIGEADRRRARAARHEGDRCEADRRRARASRHEGDR